MNCSNSKFYSLLLSGETMRLKINLLCLLGFFVFMTSLQAQWTKLATPSGSGYRYATSYASIGSRLLIGTLNAGVFYSTDGGASWTQSNTGISVPWVTGLVQSNGRLICGTQSSVYVSTDEGNSWSERNNITKGQAASFVYAYGSKVYASLASGIVQSNDGGETWTPLMNGAMPIVGISMAASGSQIVIGAENGVTYSSNDAGATWTSNTTDLPKSYGVIAVSYNDSKAIAVCQNQGAYVSTDNGMQWSTIPKWYVSGAFAYLTTYNASCFAASGSSNEGVYMTTDAGGSWTDVSQGYPQKAGAKSIGIVGTTMYLSNTSGEVWKRNIGEIVNDVLTLPAQECSLNISTVANTCSHGTVVNFQTMTPSTVRLSVFDMNGHCCSILKDEYMDPGYYKVNWESEELPSGVYVLSLQTDQCSLFKTIIVEL